MDQPPPHRATATDPAADRSNPRDRVSIADRAVSSERARIVVKLGGSLLQRRRLGHQLHAWIDAQQHRSAADERGCDLFLLVGGGSWIDAFRHWDQLHQLDPVALHWRCVAALRFSAEIVCELLRRFRPDSQWIEDPQQLQQMLQVARPPVGQPLPRSHNGTGQQGRVAVVVPAAFYSPQQNDLLPRDWSTTSDAIAALLAQQIQAKRLVILKSCQVPPGASLAELAELAIVDPVLPTAVGKNPGLTVTVQRLDPT